VVGNKCHIVRKIQISIVINKLEMSEDNFECTPSEIRHGSFESVLRPRRVS
jgi:hypothetical protein